MDAGLSLFLACIAVISFGLLWFRVRDAVTGLLSIILPAEPAEIMSHSTSSEPSSPSVSETDRPPRAADEPTRDEILDACRVLRTTTLSREQVRLVFRLLHRPLDNTLYAAAAAPTEDDEILTPYAGRRTKASYYPDAPELEYVEPRD